MDAITLIFPNQLFKNNAAIASNRDIYLVEENLFFKQINFHKHKLILHRSTMKNYANYLQRKKYKVHYIESIDEKQDIKKLIPFLAKRNIKSIHLVDVIDYLLLKRIKASCEKCKLNLTIYPSPSFMNSMEQAAAFFDQRKTYFQTDFYTHQRKQRKILLQSDGKPIGGKWTYDAENRSKYPKNETPPLVSFPKVNEYIKEAVIYVQKYFPLNYGDIQGPYFFVTNYEQANEWVIDFFKNRFAHFGLYEDAIVTQQDILHHSVISPLLNIGLLEPNDILKQSMQFADKHKIPLNSLEGFIRQILGWREFIRIVYEREGSKQRTTNYWKFKRKIPSSFWTANTGILPIDITIQKILKTGYCHHIERLMVLGNFMLLCEFDPDEVHKWFMEMFIDAYDWVMVPNVYGMTQFADGGLMTTKPYISGSNYLMKMSDYEKGEWQTIWDGLFWRFMHVHRSFFLKNPRLGMLVGTFDKMTEEKRKTHLLNANSYLKTLD